MTSLAGRTALVTGASRGIGAAIARRLAAAGASVAITARTAEQHKTLPGSLAETERTIRADGNVVQSFVADLGVSAERAGLVTAVRESLGPIHILVNNAAANFFMPFDRITEKRRQIIFELNCHAPFDLAQQILPDMLEAGRGWVINISSRTTEIPSPPYNEFALRGYPSLYAMSKAALERWTVGMAAEFSSQNIAFNTLAPVAAVLTPGALALGYRPRREELEGEEVMAEAALALAEADPGDCSGQILLSGDFLRELGRSARTLDGTADWDGRIPGYDD